jgi:hypothetical protein
LIKKTETGKEAKGESRYLPKKYKWEGQEAKREKKKGNNNRG